MASAQQSVKKTDTPETTGGAFGRRSIMRLLETLVPKASQSPTGGGGLQRSLRFRRIGTILAVIPLVFAVEVWSSWISDNAVLKERALVITAGLTSDSARIRIINDWVYHNHGFGKNNQFFELDPENETVG